MNATVLVKAEQIAQLGGRAVPVRRLEDLKGIRGGIVARTLTRVDGIEDALSRARLRER